MHGNYNCQIVQEASHTNPLTSFKDPKQVWQIRQLTDMGHTALWPDCVSSEAGEQDMLKLPELMLNLFRGGRYTFYLVFVHVFIFSAWRRLVFKGPRGIEECEFAKKNLKTSFFVIPIHLHVLAH